MPEPDVFGGGAFDTRDVIINTAGGIIGLMIQKAIKIACINSVKAKNS